MIQYVYTSIEMRPGMTIRCALDTKHQGSFSRLISSCLRKEHLHLDPVHLLSQLDIVQGCLQAVLQAFLCDQQYARVRWWMVMDDVTNILISRMYALHNSIRFSYLYRNSGKISACCGPFAATTSRFAWGPPAFWCLTAVGAPWCISRWLLL